MFNKLKSLKSKIKKKVSKGINTKNLKKNIKSKYVPTLKSGAKKAFELGKKGAKAAYAEMERRHKENLAKKAAQKKYEEINPPKKSGGFFTAMAGAAAANVAKNRMSPPICTPLDPDYVVYEMKPLAVGWLIRYGKREGGRITNKASRTISRTNSNIGGKIKVTWS